jgi:hypothetical protein
MQGGKSTFVFGYKFDHGFALPVQRTPVERPVPTIPGGANAIKLRK